MHCFLFTRKFSMEKAKALKRAKIWVRARRIPHRKNIQLPSLPNWTPWRRNPGEALVACHHCLQGWINAETETGVAVASIATVPDKGRGQGVVSAFQLWGPGNGAESQCRQNNELTTSLCQGSATEESSVGCEERSSDASTPSLSLWRRLKVLAKPSSELPASVIQHLTADTGFNERISSSCSNRRVCPTSGLINQVTPSSSILVIMVPPGRGTKQNYIFSDLKSLWEMCWNPHSLTPLPLDPGQIVCSQLQFPYL